MTEIEELMRQKKEIEQRIRELRNRDTICGKVKYEVISLPRGTEHTIAIKTDNVLTENYRRYYKVIYYENKEVMMKSLRTLIEDLQEMENKLRTS